ncbi:MAG: type I DNA topoisomerase [Vicinamibacteria bacterium]|nr:type I DNA topoisomerase [Vicinamibacteria bacterium]
MPKNLVIVESPAKAKTITRYLGRDFTVKASMGHVRDLPKKSLGVEIENGFSPQYEVLATRKKVLDEIKRAAREASSIYLAADPDREGEAICWHLAQELTARERKKVKRVAFNEITKRAVEQAFRNAGKLDMRKIDAQQARRILDRLVGYRVSPILWVKVRRGLSAGRVQSVALRLICDRELQIRAFVAEEYWTIAAQLAAGEPPVFGANLVKKNGRNIEIDNAEQASLVQAELKEASYVVGKVFRRERRRNPIPPFITSKLQQEAFKKLRFTVKKTMQVAQRLYEGVEIGPEGSVGLITYMRTDSTRVSDEAIGQVRAHIASTYGADHLPEKPNLYKSRKDAQEAHEAIRPTDLSLAPEAVKKRLSKDELALYRLVWDRFIASQMRPAVFDETVAEIAAGPYLLRARGSALKFPGFLAVYSESVEEKPGARGSGDEGGEETEPEATKTTLPPLAEGDSLRLEKLAADQHFTQPPPRFSEASLVKELEENGIGRPSTYASIIATIEAREYMEKREAKLFPTELGFLVTDLLVKHFQDIMNVEYTAAMEQELDEIEEGHDTLPNTLNQFWTKFKADLDRAKAEMKDVKAMEEKTDEICDKCGSPMVLKWGRYGKFLACSAYPTCKNTRQMAGGDGPETIETHEDVSKEVCPKDGRPMILKKGRYGPFLACVGYPECKSTKRLVRGADGKLQVETLPPLDESCPECGTPLVWRRGRFGLFAACGSYPACKYIKKKEPVDIGVLCPECNQGQIVERKGRWGRSFYGCRRYPDCTFTSPYRPVPEPCPQCGRAFLLEKETRKEGKVRFCGNPECRFSRPVK